MEQLNFIFELIGTAAFAISGAVVGLKARTDLFGVIALGAITATGGGVFRDIILGINPPTAFVKPVYIVIAMCISLGVFILAFVESRRNSYISTSVYKKVLLIADSIGLGIFTVNGCNTAFINYGGNNLFLWVFCGLITGVGGGILRDMIVDQLPDIFTKYIYAVASIIGAIVCSVMLETGYRAMAIWLPAALIVIIRLLAAHYHWSLPRIQTYDEHH
ncbi:MAG: trimeric intracellular cation channel family protein [Bulleidia sp.]|nr:trimeric intracellular cation channel family protein [Bulleidia sp.]